MLLYAENVYEHQIKQDVIFNEVIKENEILKANNKKQIN